LTHRCSSCSTRWPTSPRCPTSTPWPRPPPARASQLVTVVQDLAQLRSRWGDRAATIANNHRAKIVGGGISDTDTLDYLARLLGDEEITQLSATAGDHGRRSTTESTTFRHLAPAHLVREGKPGSAVLVYGNLPPARLRLRPWFSDRRLTGLVEAQT
jgi:type IV secretion system protein VirD4